MTVNLLVLILLGWEKRLSETIEWNADDIDLFWANSINL